MTPNNLTDEIKKVLCLKWETGEYNVTSLAKEYGLCVPSTNRWLREQGFKMKSQTELKSRYTLNESYFDKIDTEDKAYFLGFLFADGYNNTDNYSVCLCLQEKDTYIIQAFNTAIGSNRPIKFREREGDNLSNTASVTIVNKPFSLSLEKAGCVKAKTFKLTFPLLEDHLYRHFVRGYFDGDGCVSGETFSIMATEQFLLGLQCVLISHVGLKATKFIKRHSDLLNNITSIKYTGWNTFAKLYSWFYADSNIYLYRKKEKFESALNVVPKKAGFLVRRTVVYEHINSVKNR